MTPSRICIHTDTGRAYTLRQIAAEPLSYIAYYRNEGDEREEYLHRDGRSFDDAMKAVVDHINGRRNQVVDLRRVWR